jgi:hypothetical protein
MVYRLWEHTQWANIEKRLVVFGSAVWWSQGGWLSFGWLPGLARGLTSVKTVWDLWALRRYLKEGGACLW